MTNKTAKRSLVMSVISLLLCCSMLIGTTFAWFTDEVVSGNNQILAGNLDIELEYWNGSAWATVNGATELFSDELWEPGHTEVVYLKLSNLGTLALKYNLGVTIDEVPGTNVAGDPFLLSNYIYMGVVEDKQPSFSGRDDALAAVTGASVISTGYTESGEMNSKDVQYMALVVYMPTTVGNEANYKTGTTAPSIDLGIKLTATQLTYEEDSFGPDYDGDALICDIIATPETLKDIMANAEPGTVIGLAAGRYDPIVIPKSGLTLVANDALTDSININGNDDITIDGIEFQAFYHQLMVTKYAGNNQFEEYKGYMASITNTTSTAKGGNNIVIRNCTFYTNPAWVGQGYNENYVPEKYCAIAIMDQNRVSGPTTNVTIENCTFDAPSLNHIRLDYVEGDVVIRNNKFVAPSAHHNINATGNGANWTITGNTFSSWADGEYAFGTSRDGSTETTFITITDNIFNKALAAGETTPVLSIKTSYTAANSVITINNNEYNAGSAVVGAPDANGKYWMTAEKTSVGTHADVFNGLKNGEDVFLVEDINNNKQTASNGQGATAYNQTKGGVFDGNGHTLTATGLGGKWDSAIRTTGGTIKNVTIKGAMRGLFVTKGTEKVYLENVIFDGNVYTISCDTASNQGLEAKNCTFNGWTSYAATIGNVKFVDCSFGAGSGYNFSRPYAPTEYVGCDFAAGHQIDARAAVTFENCTINGEPLTAENLATLVTGGIGNATVK